MARSIREPSFRSSRTRTGRSENITGGSFTEEYVLAKLKIGHLFIGYELTGNKYGHCIVVYGIADDTLNFMDPARGMHFYRRLSYYSDAKMTVAWPNG